MNKNKSNFTIIVLSLVLIIYMITRSNNVIESVTFSISIWKDNLFPTLFPFFVVSNILIQYGFVDIIGNLLEKPMRNIFKLPGEASFVLAISMFSGFPSGAKYTTNLVKENKISKTEAERLITFTHYSNPLFIIGFIGNIILNNQNIAFIILFSHIIGGLIVGKLFSVNIKELTKEELKNKKKENNLPSFGKALQISVMDSLNTMFLLLGIVTVFLIVSSVTNELFNLPPLYHTIISGILEMTQGIKNIANLEINNFYKTLLTTTFISFGGLSVHMQVASIITEVNIKYKSFFVARIMHAIISSGLVSILYYLFIN